MNFVPSSVVSAMTQTPASGPFVLVTTPPMSSASICTAAGGACCVDGRVTGQAANTAARPTTAAPEYTNLFVTIAGSPRGSGQGFRRHDLPQHGPCQDGLITP